MEGKRARLKTTEKRGEEEQEKEIAPRLFLTFTYEALTKTAGMPTRTTQRPKNGRQATDIDRVPSTGHRLITRPLGAAIQEHTAAGQSRS
jgi:hypothetical protein